jgi:hypothetical protein
MSLGLNPQCKERLVEKIAELLPKVIVKNRMFLDHKSAFVFLPAEPILPERGPIKDKLNRYIGEAPVLIFLYGKLYQELSENQKYDLDTPTIKLIELDEYNDPLSVARRLVNEFESLPWEYTLSIKIENDFSELFKKAIKEYALSDEIRLIAPYDGFIEEFPLHSEIKPVKLYANYSALLSTFKHSVSEWEKKSSYLQIKVSGFIGMYLYSAALGDAVDVLKAFCGLGLALRLFKVNLSYQSTSQKAKFIVHRQIDNSWVIEQVHELEMSASQTFCDLTLHDLEGQLDSEDKRIDWMKKWLGLIKLVFSNKVKSKKIMLGSQWLFDSYSGRNELLSFIQMTVVLEILLGEKAVSDIIGLGELLRNRCAYLISKSHDQRLKNLDLFKKIYEIRSKIVHKGKNRLSLEERGLSLNLQWMCRRTIQEEVELLKIDLKEDE